VALLVCAVVPSADAQAALDGKQGSIAVIYPDIGEPFHRVFARIIEGIEQTAKPRVRYYVIGAAVDATDLNTRLKRDDTRVVIALGRQGLAASAHLSRGIGVVVGGVLTLPEAEDKTLMGITLAPDPALLFTRLKTLQPGIKRVFAVYDAQHNEWLIRLAREAAKAQGLELVAHTAQDLAGAVRLYQAAFAVAESGRDAIWLPQDATTVDESTILPLALRESWNRKITIFSSSYLHVKKGVLFALYPNNLALGHDLADSALRALAGELPEGVRPLRAIRSAVNLRTAGHLGLKLTRQQQRAFDSVFPKP